MKECPYCHMPLGGRIKYYELQRSPDWHIYHNSFYTSNDLERDDIKHYIEGLKKGEYTERFVHLKEISEAEYLKYKS